MGIKGLNKWLKDAYPLAIRGINKSNKFTYDNVYIDLNYIIHCIHYKAVNEDDMINKFVNYIRYYIKCYRPVKKLFMCFDGKLSKIKKFTVDKRIEMNKKRDYNVDYDIFKYGSEFMKRLDTMIKSWDNSFLGVGDSVDIVYNDYNENGEGEIKIYREILKCDERDRNLIICNDSDLIVIGMLVDRDIDILMFQTSNKEVYLVKLNIIKLQYRNQYNDHYYDFVLLSILNGNDYFPKLKYVTFENIWNAYKNYINCECILNSDDIELMKANNIVWNGMMEKKNYYLVNPDGEINMDNFKVFIWYLYKEMKPIKKHGGSLVLNCRKNTRKYIEIVNYCLRMYRCEGSCGCDIEYCEGMIHPIIFLVD